MQQKRGRRPGVPTARVGGVRLPHGGAKPSGSARRRMRGRCSLRRVEGMDENEPEEEKQRSSNWLVYGMVFGMLAGVVIGSLTDQLALWMVFGISIGIAVSAGFSKSGK